MIEQETALEEIEETAAAIADEWDLWFEDLLHRQQSYGLKPGWIYYRLLEAKPPLQIWQKYAALKGYKPGWAFIRYQAQLTENEAA